MFNIEKLIQACNYLIKKNNSILNYTKLIKLLYLADRESLQQSIQTITGDTYVSMDNGPVLSRLYDLIKGKYRNEADQSLWNSRFIKDEYFLRVATDNIPQGELSIFEMKILDKIDEKYKNDDSRAMIKYVHEICSEWENPNGSSIPIKPEKILECIGKTKEEIDWILSETEGFEEEERAFQSLAV